MQRDRNQKAQGFPIAMLSTKENGVIHLKFLEKIIFNLEF